INGPRTSPRGPAAMARATSRCSALIASSVSRGKRGCAMLTGMIADAILVVHFGIVLFIVGGLLAVWLGAALRWQWVRNRWFRYAHLAAIAYVAGEALIGIACPLTVWEAIARGGVRPESFVGRWVQRVLYYRA